MTFDSTPDDRARVFEDVHARNLRALAYRMLGSRADAQDVVQDAWLRWSEVDPATVQHAGAYLSTLVTRLCLDRLGSAAARREQYIGMWLPEPLVDEAEAWSPGPEVQTEFAQDVSVAFLLTLERLSPLERAAFLLHDVFDLGFDDVGARLQRSAETCRQLASRARTHLRAGYARCEVQQEERERLFGAFAMALMRGDVEALAGVLADDAVMVNDGGGKVSAVPRPLVGAARVAQALVGFAKGYDPAQVRARPAQINGMVGFVMFDAEGRPIQTVALATTGTAGPARIAGVYVVRNPDKLSHLVWRD
jgi:RNA polymerase sigma-70 factor (ECF subfamily)